MCIKRFRTNITTCFHVHHCNYNALFSYIKSSSLILGIETNSTTLKNGSSPIHSSPPHSILTIPSPNLTRPFPNMHLTDLHKQPPLRQLRGLAHPHRLPPLDLRSLQLLPLRRLHRPAGPARRLGRLGPQPHRHRHGWGPGARRL